MMNANEPTTGEIVRALRCDGDANNCVDCRYATYDTATILCDQEQNVREAADRLESQERTIATMRGDNFDAISVTNVLAYLDTVMGLIHCADGIKDLIVSMQGTAEELTARAEKAEAERDAAKAYMKRFGCLTCEGQGAIGLNEPCWGCRDKSNWKMRGLQPQDGEGK